MKTLLGRLSYLARKHAFNLVGRLCSLFTVQIHSNLSYHRVLLFHTLKFGDSVLLTPSIKAFLKDSRREVYILCGQEGQQIFKGLLPQEQIIVYNPHTLKDYQNLINQLKSLKFDLVVDFHNNFFDLKKSFLPYKISHDNTKRIGFKTKIYHPWLFHQTIFWESEKQHEIDSYLQIPQLLQLPITDKSGYVFQSHESQEETNKILARHGFDHRKHCLILMHAAALGPRKRWPSSYFATLAQTLISAENTYVIFTGTKQEVPIVLNIFEQMTQHPRIINLCGKLPFSGFVEAIRQCNLLVSIDTSAIHIAYATQTPTIALFGPTQEITWRPYLRNKQILLHSDIECRPCDRNFKNNEKYQHVRCMKELSVAKVLEACQKLLHTYPSIEVF